jgi:hypothetical protein
VIYHQYNATIIMYHRHHVQKKRFQHHRHHRGTKKNCQTQDIGSLLRGATGSKSKANSKTRLRLREAQRLNVRTAAAILKQKYSSAARRRLAHSTQKELAIWQELFDIVHGRSGDRILLMCAWCCPFYRYLKSRPPWVAKKGANTRDSTAMSLMRMLRDGPEVSFRGSPMVSPITAALWQSDPLGPRVLACSRCSRCCRRIKDKQGRRSRDKAPDQGQGSRCCRRTEPRPPPTPGSSCRGRRRPPCCGTRPWARSSRTPAGVRRRGHGRRRAHGLPPVLWRPANECACGAVARMRKTAAAFQINLRRKRRGEKNDGC